MSTSSVVQTTLSVLLDCSRYSCQCNCIVHTVVQKLKQKGQSYDTARYIKTYAERVMKNATRSTNEERCWNVHSNGS